MMMVETKRAVWAIGLGVVASFCAVGCGDDSSASSSSVASASASSTASGSSSATSGSGGGGSGGGGMGGGTGGAPAAEYAAVVRGELADKDLASAKATHDMIASMGEAQSKAAGDHAHDVLLGTMLLDSIPNEFLAIDRWDDADAMEAFYADPNVQQAFGALFAKPPTIEYFTYHPDWVSWGDMASGDAFDPYYFHFALGVLKDADTAKNHAAHDMVASGGKQPSLDAGNVAHVVWLGLHDERRFLGVDIWKSADNMEAFYTSPQFVMAFGALFESVEQPVYQSTDWHQW